tara:strand:- start:6521 stop:7300 length:780 start_codon:yes stop_codon:yes gene_type:complete
LNPVLVFDIETVPDIDGIRKLYGVGSDLSSKDIAEMAFQSRRQVTGSDFLELYLQKIVAISCALRNRNEFSVWSLGDLEDSEADLIRRFFEGIDKYTPQLVSWNGRGFDFPVLNYRSMIHGIRAHRYWEVGENDRNFKWNNYLNRYHSRHLDLMDFLSLHQPRANASLNDMSQLIGFPGKLGIDGSQVWEKYQDGEIVEIRNYCETDVLNTYLMFLRFQYIRGILNDEEYIYEVNLVRTTLKKSTESHWKIFLKQWKDE